MRPAAPHATLLPMAVAQGQTSVGDAAAGSWEQLRAAEDIQFAPVEMPPAPPREPTWLDRLLRWLADTFGDLFGGALGNSWPVLRWVLLAAAIAAVLYALWRIFDPMMRRKPTLGEAGRESEWRPDRAAAEALLEDADRLAAEGRFDEATHLLLQRSVSQIARVRPDWVPPSSTARELARLPTLSEPARLAFGEIALQVERSLFALRQLERSDWETARAAYARFALVRLDGAGA